ncbi:hypothetical protein NUW54_g14541 [Trametes sanguinea]|uniref:Uncharacterized protein n=1 Tax=Trametes sanguinea TaxID=158606 RepID=A0ACC1MBM3_9APHY|nr:hypothetical protein NUW54_g14541 [Trametes sanguinea]
MGNVTRKVHAVLTQPSCTSGSGMASTQTRKFNSGRLIRARTVYTGYTLSYECELMALSMAIGFAYLKNYHQLHLFADCKGAITNLLDTSMGRAASTNVCRILRDWFERDERNRLTIHYCPGHSGVEENEAVDADSRNLISISEVSRLPTPCMSGASLPTPTLARTGAGTTIDTPPSGRYDTPAISRSSA